MNCSFSEAIFDDSEQRTDEEKVERKIKALQTFRTFIYPIWTPLMGETRFSEGTKLVFDALQNPIINKQVVYRFLQLYSIFFSKFLFRFRK